MNNNDNEDDEELSNCRVKVITAMDLLEEVLTKLDTTHLIEILREYPQMRDTLVVYHALSDCVIDIDIYGEET